MADAEPARRARKASVGDQRDLVGQSLAIQRRRGRKHLAHARPALGPFVADDDDLALVDRARLDGGEGVFLAIEAPRRAFELQAVHARDLHDRAIGGDVALEPHDAAGRRYPPRLLQRHGRQLDLTDEGRLLYELGSSILAATDSLHQTFEDRRTGLPRTSALSYARDGDSYLFMDLETYDQIPVPSSIMGEQGHFLSEGATAQVALHEGTIGLVMTALMIRKPLEFTAFPSVLLLATLLRLALNIASTRLILSNGQTGVGGTVLNGRVDFTGIESNPFANLFHSADKIGRAHV